LALLEELEALFSLEPELLLEQRYAKYRAIGRVLEDSAGHAIDAIKA
jgi:acetyl-CoA carboxylase alpha subunit